MIYGKCITNLDGFKFAKFPTQFLAVPRIGEKVQDYEGRCLNVVQITYAFGKTDVYPEEQTRPYIIIELNK